MSLNMCVIGKFYAGRNERYVSVISARVLFEHMAPRDDGGRCLAEPTCFKRDIDKHGVVKIEDRRTNAEHVVDQKREEDEFVVNRALDKDDIITSKKEFLGLF